MTSLNFSRKESIIFLFQIAHYNLSICNKHSNKTETKGSLRKNSIGKQREFLNEKPLTTSFLMGRQTTNEATVETPVLLNKIKNSSVFKSVNTMRTVSNDHY